MDALPKFKYHPEPLRTGAIEASNGVCVSCGKSRGYIYTASVYAEQDLHDSLCPWCIADGSAARKFAASFNDAHPLLQDGVPPPIVEEVSERTPGYISWQQEQWLSHCNDACEFQGDVSPEEVRAASDETRSAWKAMYQQTDETWQLVTGRYGSGSSVLYKFVCRHCGIVLFGWDLS